MAWRMSRVSMKIANQLFLKFIKQSTKFFTVVVDIRNHPCQVNEALLHKVFWFKVTFLPNI